MSAKKNRTANLSAASPRQVASRFSLIVLVFSSIALIITNQIGSNFSAHVRSAVSDVVTPVIITASKPLDAIAGIGTWFGEIINLRSENIALKNTNLQLMKWQTVAKNMEIENRNLRNLMNAVSLPKSNYITTKVVSDSGGPYVRSALVNGGLTQGVKKDFAVINENGLVGRVIEAGNTSSRILLINDINSRIPVMGEESRERTILVGNNDRLPSLSYVSADSRIKLGERIVTSGDGGVFPSGIAVGIVSKIENGKINVQPFVDTANIEYVSIIDYSF